VSWPEEYMKKFVEPRFDPWPTKYLMPAYKWLPINGPNDYWEVLGVGYNNWPTPPVGEPVYWWKQLKQYWPTDIFGRSAPWENKVFGAWPASQISMPEDLVNWPPFGIIKLKMTGEPAQVDQQIAFLPIKMHMRAISNEQSQLKIAVTPMGPRYYFRDQPWEQYQKEYGEFLSALKEKKMADIQEMMAAEIAKPKGESKKGHDLFA
jgi:hypothetical protein